MVSLPGPKIDQVRERIEDVMSPRKGGSILEHVRMDNTERRVVFAMNAYRYYSASDDRNKYIMFQSSRQHSQRQVAHKQRIRGHC